MVPPSLFGMCVRSTANALGVGKLVEMEGDRVTIEYFESPVCPERPRQVVAGDTVKAVSLETQTRVYFQDEKGVWRIGRIDDHIDSNCFIALPNQQQARIQEANVYVRWDKPITDPSEHLAARLTETPFFHGARADLLSGFVRQRAAAGGLTGLLSAPIELERHQVEVVRRVLRDPVQRYLLADEVGLGKTIAAGVIIRQYVLDHPKDHRVLVIVPEQLIDQWRSELKERLQVSETFGHRLTIVSLEQIEQLPPTALEAGMVVIDEAHQAVANWQATEGSPAGERFKILRRITAPAAASRLLLLSATPVRRNEDGFLALLHLLDPDVYRLGDRAAFLAKVAQRQELANLFYAFREEQQSYFLEGMVQQLSEMFPDDRRLSGLLARLQPQLEPAVPEETPERREAVRAVRTHLSETYRLHRRLLRNRRTTAVEGLLPGRAGLTTLSYPDATASRVEAALERWRCAAAAASWGQSQSVEAQARGRVYLVLLEAAWSDLDALAFCVTVRLGENPGGRANPFGLLTGSKRLAVLRTTPLFEDEKVELKKLVQAIRSNSDPNGDRLNQLLVAAEAQLGKGQRVVVFTSSPALADQFFTLASRARRLPVWRHSLTETEWHAFRDPASLGLLVCDYRAEEGLNLQGGKTCMLHADLPLSPNRLEQRLGRLDRFGVGHAVVSLAPVPEECPYQQAWLECLSDAYAVFSSSIAALQYVVEDEMRSLSSALLTDGDPRPRRDAHRRVPAPGVSLLQSLPHRNSRQQPRNLKLMSYRICKTFEIENGHMLSKHPDKCRFPQEHTRKVEFTLEADALDPNEMACDFKVVKETMEALLDQYDHAMSVNTDDPKYADLKEAYGDRVIGFEKADPTTELLAKTIYEHSYPRLSKSSRAARSAAPTFVC